jgi:hypothetical protein
MSTKRPIAVAVNPQWRHRVKTFADLAAKLGDIPADRILVDPPPGLATEEELLRFVEVDHVLCELVDGVLVEKPMGFEESALALWLGHHLRTYLNEHNLGELA